MVKFEDFIKTIDKDIRVEIYSRLGEIIHNGKISDIKYYPDNIIRIIPQSTSREVYLEIYVY